jgi:cysteine desulfurase / selenocysteine lyase
MNETLKNIEFDVESIRKDFPILSSSYKGKELIYFDNSATTQKPKSVLNKIAEYYTETNSNVHRGFHRLSRKATEEYENARIIIKDFLNARKESEIIFTKGTTESINLVANSFCQTLAPCREILITEMEHHSNIVPWQLACDRLGLELKVTPVNKKGELELDILKSMLNKNVGIVALTHISNSLGTINPIKEIIKEAHNYGIPVLIDGAQSAQHTKIDVQDLDCDFYAFSGHKAYGPTGIGVLYGKKELLNKMPPYQGGGEMIERVRFDKTTYNVLPFKFEAGTPNICGAIALGEALKYIDSIGLETIEEYEHELIEYALQRMSEIPEIQIIGNPKERIGAISFVLDNIHAIDLGTMIDLKGVALRVGHHCNQPLLEKFGLPATARVSFAMYNTKDEIDKFVNYLNDVIKVLT